MAKAMEESFKVCGLCSQLVDESVEITNNMRDFLCGFLGINERTLPSKICLECYQKAMDCRSFKDRCDKAIHKLHKSALYSSMILGGTPSGIAAAARRSEKEDRELTKAEMKTRAELDIVTLSPVSVKTKPKPGKAKPKPASRRELDSLGNPEILKSGPRSTRSLRESDLQIISTPRSTRHATPKTPAPVKAKKTLAKRGKGVVDNLPSVFIRRSDVAKAEKSLRRFGPPYPYFGENNRKRKLSVDEITPFSKRARKEMASPKTTSSGRVVKAKNRELSFGDVEKSPAPKNHQVTVDHFVAKKSPPAPAKAAKSKASPKPGPKSKQAAAVPEPIVVSDDEEDMEEIFPTVGPYQCEICQKITDTKQEFVDHIKKFHIDVVDEEVLRSLESDLRKSRKKAEIAAKKNGPNGAIKTASAKKPGPASKKPVRATAGSKSSPPKKQLSRTQQRKLNTSLEERTCKICNTVISSNSSSDHERHRQSKYCRKIAKERELSQEDPLASPIKGHGKEETADELAQRTCQFCGKVLRRKIDLSGHYKTKTCIAKQYEREAQETITNGDLPEVQMNNIENPDQSVSNTPVIVENAEVDTGYIDDVPKETAPADSPPSLPTSTTTEEKLPTIAKMEPSPAKVVATQPDSVLENPSQFMATSTSVDQPQGDWLGGPITTIADTLSPQHSQQNMDPIVTNGQAGNEITSTPTEILGGVSNEGTLIAPTT